jgi:hypothetical protein
LVITSCNVFSLKSVRYMKAGIRVANLISFSCTNLRLDLYSFSSSVNSIRGKMQDKLLAILQMEKGVS